MVNSSSSCGELLTPGLDNTRLFMSLTAGAGTRSKVFSLHYQAYSLKELGEEEETLGEVNRDVSLGSSRAGVSLELPL